MAELAQTLVKDQISRVRYEDLKPCYNAFIDTRTPGSDQKENFTIIGPGVSENPEQYVHIVQPHGFNIGGARQPPGCVNSQHSHDTEEVFFVHSGTWVFMLGETGQDAQRTLYPGDLISIPTRVFRGFENVGEDTGFLWAVLGQDDPGRVLWAPQVFEMARDYGLILLDNGQLIDTQKGETVAPGQTPMPATTRAQVNALQRFSVRDLEACCISADTSQRWRGLIGPDAPINRPHGFVIDQLHLAAGAHEAGGYFAAPEVLFVHTGELMVTSDSGDIVLGAGDTASIPPGAERAYIATGHRQVTAIRVRGDQVPA
ncbi:MAG: cupin domain-containing protein [Pseudomonadota bacterium]